MLETVDLKRRIEKEEYEKLKDELITRLVNLQQRCIREKLPVAICVDGWSAAGKGTTISKLVKDLDPRYFRVHAMHAPTETERRYHFMARYWERIGQYGTFTIFDESWYSEALETMLVRRDDGDRGLEVSHRFARNETDFTVHESESALRRYAESASVMERQLRADGYLIIKCFFHVSKKKQRKRLKDLMSNPTTYWRVDESDLSQNENYDAYYDAIDRFLERTDVPQGSWHVIAADNGKVRRIEFMQALVAELEPALEQHLRKKENPQHIPPKTPLPESRYTLLPMPRIETVSHDLTLDEATYEEELKREQDKLEHLQAALYLRSIPMMLVFEGWDAAGKGGAIKRVAAALDARDYRVVPSASPTPPEKQHPFLWRYWINLPKSGHIHIYDRSWYGRVMVERIEGFCTDEEWRRAYEEINDFEWEMHRCGTLMCKFWINVSQDEQLVRFNERKNDPNKAWKLTDEDWRNREKYPQYCEAIDDMLKMTSTDFAPWLIVESDDKKYARIKVLKAVNRTIEQRLKKDAG